MCHHGGFNLHKFTSNKREVIEAIPTEDRAKGIKELNLEKDELPIERALGISWCIESDCFKFHIVVQDHPLARRGILSTVSTVYDPLGFLAPLLLVGKRLLQELCKGKVDWDDPIPENVRECWLRWREELHLLENLAVPRCFKPEDFGTVTSTQLHHFLRREHKWLWSVFLHSLRERQRQDPLFAGPWQGKGSPLKDGHHTTSRTHRSSGVSQS